jgi:hypothetical protein
VTISLRVLFDADTAKARAAGHAWTAMADTLDDACEELIKGTQDLEYQWPDGPAADAAHARTRETRNEASNAVPHCRVIGRALREYADTISSLQHHLKDITAEATRAGLQVDLGAGTVSAPQHMYQQSSAPHVIAQTVNGFMHQLQGLVDKAADVDGRTAATLNANLPDTQTGFGSLSSPKVTMQQVEAMKGKPAAEVNSWWNGLTAEQQEQILREFPSVIGNIDGVPADDRDTANRSWLDQKRQAVQAEYDYIQDRLRVLDPLSDEAVRLKERLWSVRHDKQNLDDIHEGLQRAGSRGMLLGLDPAGDGKAIISVGNPDTAQHTGVWVPGLSTDAGSTKDNVERMIWLNDAADRLTKDTPGDVATVYWLGYDAPEVVGVSVAFEERSRQGAQPYVDFMQGMRATHEGEPGHLVAMGHSYGSTVLGEAARTGDLPVDDIVTQGSPGMHVNHARDLNIDPRHVWAGSAADDPVSETSNVTKWTTPVGTLLGGPVGGAVGWGIGELYEDGHNRSPHYEDFGANKYTVDTEGHTEYWNPDSRSLQNQASILMGQYEWTTLDHGSAPTEKP